MKYIKKISAGLLSLLVLVSCTPIPFLMAATPNSQTNANNDSSTYHESVPFTLRATCNAENVAVPATRKTSPTSKDVQLKQGSRRLSNTTTGTALEGRWTEMNMPLSTKVQNALRASDISNRKYVNGKYECRHFSDDMEKYLEKYGIQTYYVTMHCYEKPEYMMKMDQESYDKLPHAIIAFLRKADGSIARSHEFAQYITFYEPNGGKILNMFANNLVTISLPTQFATEAGVNDIRRNATTSSMRRSYPDALKANYCFMNIFDDNESRILFDD